MEITQQLDHTVSATDSVGQQSKKEQAMINNTNYSAKTVGKPFVDDPKMRLRDVEVFYGGAQAIHGVSLDVGKNEVVAMIGPSGCGKSTFLRCLNRMNDTIDICRV